MSGFAGMIVTIEETLLQMLTDLTYDAGNGPEPAFALATDDPSLEFDQEPYCELIPDDFTDEKVGYGTNDYTIPFIAVVTLSLENKQRTQPETYKYMYNLVETVLNAVDTADFNGALGNDLGTYLMDTSKVRIRPVQSKGGAILLARIDIAIKYQVDL